MQDWIQLIAHTVWAWKVHSGIHWFDSAYNYLPTKIPPNAVKNKVQKYSTNQTLYQFQQKSS